MERKEKYKHFNDDQYSKSNLKQRKRSMGKDTERKRSMGKDTNRPKT